MNKIGRAYGKRLSLRVGPGENPTPIYVWILILCPTALLIAVALWLPAQSALRHGVPITGNIQTVDKHGFSETDSIQSIVNIDVSIFVVCLPLLFSTIAYLIGWLGNFREDEEDFRNTPRVD